MLYKCDRCGILKDMHPPKQEFAYFNTGCDIIRGHEDSREVCSGIMEPFTLELVVKHPEE